MTEEKRNTDNPSDGYRTEYIGARVSPKQKGNIRQPVQKYGMTVSGCIPARAYGYKPEARPSERQESVMDPLAGCCGDMANYMSALRGMNPEKRGQMFESYPFMSGWSKELDRLAEQFTDILDKGQLPDGMPGGTGNDEDKEVKSRQQRRNSPHAESTSSSISRKNRGTRKILDACFTWETICCRPVLTRRESVIPYC